MRIGGGLGGTRRGGPDVNIKHSGREDNERERERYRLEREREDRSGGGQVSGGGSGGGGGGGGGGGAMDRRPDFRDRGDRKFIHCNKKIEKINNTQQLYRIQRSSSVPFTSNRTQRKRTIETSKSIPGSKEEKKS